MLKKIHTHRAFTLIEMIIAMTIFGLMSTLTILIYFNVSETSRRLQISRELSETSRQIIEYISQNVRERGIALNAPPFDPATTHGPWRADFMDQYITSGSEVLPIGNIDMTDNTGKDSIPIRYFVYGKKDDTMFTPCTPQDQENPQIHCGLYLKEGTDDFISLVDRFRPDENKKRIRITHLRFYISADDLSKVTLVMTLELMPRMGVSASLIRGTKMHIQTTISERFYQQP